MSTTEALIAWVDMFNAGGLLSTLVAFDFAKAVIDNEIALMLKVQIAGSAAQWLSPAPTLLTTKWAGSGPTYPEMNRRLKYAT